MEDLLQESERLLEESDYLEILESDGDTSSHAVNDHIRAADMASLDTSQSRRLNGRVEVWLSADAMLCFASLFPPRAGGELLEPDDVLRVLDQHGVTFGLDRESIEKAVFACNTDRDVQNDVVVARGRPSCGEAPGHWELSEEVVAGSDSHKGDGSGENGGVDHRARSPIVLVEEGQVIATRVQPVQGTVGTTVHGEEIAYHRKSVPQYQPGAGVRVEGDLAYAAYDGRIVWDAATFRVHQALVIRGDVDYRTGHIDFPGDVIIDGQIKDGFHVHAGGSVVCRKTLDASDVQCDGDLQINHGIIGRKKGRVRVGGTVRTRYIENCQLEAGGDIGTLVGCVNSHVQTRGEFASGRKSLIVGSRIYAANGVRTNQIGTDSGSRSEIYCGTDFEVRRKIEWIRDKSIEYSARLGEARLQLQGNSNPPKRLEDIKEKLEMALSAMNQTAERLISRLEVNDGAEIQVFGTVFPDTYVEICNVGLTVSQKLSSVRFRLDKPSGKINVEPLCVRQS